MELTRRAVLDVGRKCNANCQFCYYKDSHEGRNFSTKELKKRLNRIKTYGIKSIEITGGEAALRDDIFELISYAKKLNFNQLGIITNGIAFSNFNFTQDIKKAGLDEVKFSIHGPNPKIHDKLTGVGGSFKKLIQGIKNSKKVGLVVKTSTVINQINYKDLINLSNFLIKINPSRVNFLLMNSIIDAERLRKEVIAPYSKVAPYIHQSIDILIKKDIDVAVRYVPFCFMKGYEKYVYNLNQVQYDSDEWDYLIKNRVEYGRIISKLNLFVGFLNLLINQKWDSSNFFHKSVIQSKLLRFNTRGKQCKICKYESICDGLWKSYARLYGYNELKPSIGKNITDPIYFIKN